MRVCGQLKRTMAFLVRVAREAQSGAALPRKQLNNLEIKAAYFRFQQLIIFSGSV